MLKLQTCSDLGFLQEKTLSIQGFDDGNREFWEVLLENEEDEVQSLPSTAKNGTTDPSGNCLQPAIKKSYRQNH